MRFFIYIFKRLFSYEVIIGASIYFTLYACFVSYRTLEGKVTDRYGEIKGRYVIYRGDDAMVEGV